MMTDEEKRLAKEVFEIAMHSMKTEELAIQLDMHKRQLELEKDYINNPASTINLVMMDINRRAEIINRKRERLFELMDKLLYKRLI